MPTEKNAAFLPRQWGFKLDRQRVNIGTNEHIFMASNDRLVWGTTVMLVVGREKPQSLERKACPTVALFTTDLVWATLGLNPGPLT